MKEILITYTTYNLWANTRIVDALKSIDPTLLDKELKSSFATINKTICHIWGAEEIWHKRLNHEEKPTAIGFNFSGDPKEAVKSFLEMSVLFNDFISKKEDAFFSSPCKYNDLRGNSHTNFHWEMIMHCMNHSTYHRGQVVTMMREVGETKVPSTDLIAYLRETKK